MIRIFSRNSLILCNLITAGVVILLCFDPAIASELKDIRVGEYEGFTRIVFEFDALTAKPEIQIQEAGQLLATFSKTKVNLVRKIPLKRSPHVEDIQIWQRKADLALLLIFDYMHIRIESFQLSRPARFAIDVFPIAKPPEATVTAPAAPVTAVEEDKKATPVEAKPRQAARVEDNKSIPSFKAKVMPDATKVQHENMPTKALTPQTRLQRYLVVILVIITIVILILLLLMLLTRRWLIDEKTLKESVALLQQQDKKMASLDADIKEQFKRYDEA